MQLWLPPVKNCASDGEGIHDSSSIPVSGAFRIRF